MPATDADWQGLPSRVLGRTDRGSEFFGYDSTYLEKDKPKTLVEFEKVAAVEGICGGSCIRSLSVAFDTGLVLLLSLKDLL